MSITGQAFTQTACRNLTYFDAYPFLSLFLPLKPLLIPFIYLNIASCKNLGCGLKVSFSFKGRNVNNKAKNHFLQQHWQQVRLHRTLLP